MTSPATMTTTARIYFGFTEPILHERFGGGAGVDLSQLYHEAYSTAARRNLSPTLLLWSSSAKSNSKSGSNTSSSSSSPSSSSIHPLPSDAISRLRNCLAAELTWHDTIETDRQRKDVATLVAASTFLKGSNSMRIRHVSHLLDTIQQAVEETTERTAGFAAGTADVSVWILVDVPLSQIPVSLLAPYRRKQPNVHTTTPAQEGLSPRKRSTRRSVRREAVGGGHAASYSNSSNNGIGCPRSPLTSTKNRRPITTTAALVPPAKSQKQRPQDRRCHPPPGFGPLDDASDSSPVTATRDGGFVATTTPTATGAVDENTDTEDRFFFSSAVREATPLSFHLPSVLLHMMDATNDEKEGDDGYDENGGQEEKKMEDDDYVVETEEVMVWTHNSNKEEGEERDVAMTPVPPPEPYLHRSTVSSSSMMKTSPSFSLMDLEENLSPMDNLDHDEDMWGDGDDDDDHHDGVVTAVPYTVPLYNPDDGMIRGALVSGDVAGFGGIDPPPDHSWGRDLVWPLPSPPPPFLPHDHHSNMMMQTDDALPVLTSPSTSKCQKKDDHLTDAFKEGTVKMGRRQLQQLQQQQQQPVMNGDGNVDDHGWTWTRNESVVQASGVNDDMVDL